MSDLAERLRVLELELERRRGRREELQRVLDREEKELQVQREEEAANGAACELVGAAIEARRAELRERVELLVTRGLRATFGRSDFTFELRTKLNGTRVGIEPHLVSRFGDRDVDVGIVEGRAGGIADVLSFLLRTVVLALARPKLAPFLILDEPFRHLSGDFLRGASSLVRELSREAGIQFVIVTHEQGLLDAADTIYRARVDERGATTFELEHDLRDETFHAAPQEGDEPEEPHALDGEASLVDKNPGKGAAVRRVTVPEDVLSRRQARRSAVPTRYERRVEIWEERKRRKRDREREEELRDSNLKKRRSGPA